MPTEFNAPSATLRLVQNGAMIVIARAVAMGTLLLCVPVMISRLGESGYGIIESVLALAAMVVILQSSISGTILWRTAGLFGAGDRPSIVRTIRLGVTAAMLLTGLCLPICIGCGDAIVRQLHLPEGQQANVTWIALSVVGVTLIAGVNQSALAAISGFQRAGWAAIVQSLGMTVTNVVIMSAVLMGAGIEAVLWGIAAGATITSLCAWPVASSYCGYQVLLPAWPNRQELRALAPYGAMLFISSLSVVFRDQADKLLLSSFDSPVRTAYFSMGQRLAGLVMQVCVVLFVPMTATFGAFSGRGDWQSVRSLYAKWAGWMAMLTGIVAVTVISLRAPLLTLWLGQDEPAAHFFVGCLLFATSSAVILAGPGVALVKGIGRPGLETSYAMVTLLLVLISKPLAMHWFGPTSVVISSAMSWVLGALFFLVLLYRHVHLPVAALRRALGIWMVTAAVAAGGWYFGQLSMFQCHGRLPAALCLLLAGPAIAGFYVTLLFALRLVDLTSFTRGFWGKLRAVRKGVYEKSIPSTSP